MLICLKIIRYALFYLLVFYFLLAHFIAIKVEERIRYGQKEALRQCSVGRVEHNLQSDEDFGLNLLKKSRQCPENFYRTTILEIKNLLDGHIENMAFEDSIRFFQ